MLRGTGMPLILRRSVPALQGGWGSSSAGSGSGSSNVQGNASGGGWGSAPVQTGGGGWGSAPAQTGGGGWGSAPAQTGGGGWGSTPAQTGGGWGSAPPRSSGGGWGSAGSWSDGDGGWSQAPTGHARRESKPRGGFRRNRPSSSGWGDGAAGVWGEPAPASEEAWKAAPPSFAPPVRRVDPLTLTAVEVNIDGVKKLVGQRVQITGLADETSWQTLKDHLRQAGEVVFCRIFSGGRAMAELTTPEDAARVITELQASELEGATIFIREDREDTVLLNTRRKIREAREAKLRQRKEEVERHRAETAHAQEAEAAASKESSSK